MMWRDSSGKERERIKRVTQGEKSLKFEKWETKSTLTHINRTKDLFINWSDRGRGGETLCVELNTEEEKRKGFDPPLKDLSNYKKQDGNWQRHPQIPCLRVDPPITVLQISPSQTLREPQTLLPEDFTQPLQHTAEQRHTDELQSCLWKSLFIQNDLHCIQGIHFYQFLLYPGTEPMTLALLVSCIL